MDYKTVVSLAYHESQGQFFINDFVLEAMAKQNKMSKSAQAAPAATGVPTIANQDIWSVLANILGNEYTNAMKLLVPSLMKSPFAKQFQVLIEKIKRTIDPNLWAEGRLPQTIMSNPQDIGDVYSTMMGKGPGTWDNAFGGSESRLSPVEQADIATSVSQGRATGVINLVRQLTGLIDNALRSRF